jgi:hypothetical protein
MKTTRWFHNFGNRASAFSPDNSIYFFWHTKNRKACCATRPRENVMGNRIVFPQRRKERQAKQTYIMLLRTGVFLCGLCAFAGKLHNPQ